ncbi:MAG: HNH endonuclease domain-containing protein [Chitinophagales bacterium]
MDKILGIDLGTNSIGWALRNPDASENQIEKFGVVTFNKGVGVGKTGEYSFAAERTKKRSTRRLYQSRKYRLWATLETLINEGYCPLTIDNLNRWRHYSKEEAVKNNNGGRVYPVDDIVFDQWIKLDFNGDGKPDYTSPFQLRKDLAEIVLDFSKEVNRFKLGRALYHIAQRRGFKSSRKSSGDDKPKETDSEEIVDLQYSEKKKNKVIAELFEKYVDAKTIGWLFAELENDKVRIREGIAQYAIRENYKDEVKYIFHIQNLGFDHVLYKKLVESGNNKNDGWIFYKRPLRSQKGLIGKCTLESSKYRAPISHPKFELFRAWSFINNIKYKPENAIDANWIPLPLDLKQELLKEKFFRKSKAYFPFSEIDDFIARKGFKGKLNYSLKTTVSGCPVSARLKDIFGEDYLSVRKPKTKAPKAEKEYYDIEDIWHVLFSCEDQEFVVEFATDKLNLSAEQVKQFAIAWNALPVGYGMLSLNAIGKINRFLEKGLIYTEAVLLANIPSIIGERLYKENEELFLESISQLIDENRKQKTILSIVNSLVARYKSEDFKFGFKDNNYKLVESDKQDIQNTIEDTYGATRWKGKPEEEKQDITAVVTDCYQALFRSTGLNLKLINGEKHFEVKSGNYLYYKTETGFYRLPKLIDSLAEFLSAHFELSEKQLKKIYHPSEINIYPPSKEDKDGVIKLGSPKTGSFKNPMAMRTLHELRKLVNHMIETKQIDSDTRLVVEVARELNDSNKRWAIEAWQRQREAENQEFAQAIEQLLTEVKGLKADPNNENDIDKIRLFYEQNDEQTLPAVIETTEAAKGKKKRDAAKDEVVKWGGHGKKLIDKYRLWKEQGFQCIYTGKFITLSDLFGENVTDIEHTIPRSISFDNSLANQTVCFADYNRTVKKKQIPTQLNNYEKEWDGYSAILPRLDKWKDKVERIKQQIDFWKTKAQKASDKAWKDDAIRQRHLWQMELDYWKNKLDRFTLQEVTAGFKNSQKVDTQLISKYALHYLKTYFEKVDVQKGSITAEFRKIYGLQVPDEKKDRSKHSHHAKDAAVLTLIPFAAKRDDLLKEYYQHKEQNQNYTTEPYKGFKREFVWSISDSVLINNVSKEQSLTPAKRKVRKRGKEVVINGKNRWSTGDSIRGQLHQETFYGAIKPAKRGEKGNIEKDENGKMILEEKLRYVVRVPFQFKKDANTPGFKTLEEIQKQIVDEGLKADIAKQVSEAGGLREAFEKGIYLLDKNGQPHGNKIRHIRVWSSVSEPLVIKKQTNLSKTEYKQHYYAANGENILCALYQRTVTNKKTGLEKQDRLLEIVSLKEAADLLTAQEISKTKDLEKILYRKNNKGEVSVNEQGEKEQPYAILKPAMKAIFYDENIDELKKREDESTTDYYKRISYRMYKIVKFTGGRLTFQHHLEARNDKELEKAYPENQIFKVDEKQREVVYGGRGTSGFTEKVSDALKCNVFNKFEPWPKLLYSADWLNMAIEGKHFELTPDGKIEWVI